MTTGGMQVTIVTWGYLEATLGRTIWQIYGHNRCTMEDIVFKGTGSRRAGQCKCHWQLKGLHGKGSNCCNVIVKVRPRSWLVHQYFMIFAIACFTYRDSFKDKTCFSDNTGKLA